METFLSMPGVVDFQSSLCFSPSRGTIDPHSLKVDLTVGSVGISVNALHSLLSLLKDCHQFEANPPREAPLVPAHTSATEMLSPTTPMSPLIRALRSVSGFSSSFVKHLSITHYLQATSARPLTSKLKKTRPSVRFYSLTTARICMLKSHLLSIVMAVHIDDG